MSFFSKLFGRSEPAEPPPDAYAAVSCEKCFRDFEGQVNWGRECPVCNSLLHNKSRKPIGARYCNDCLKKDQRCLKCGGLTLPISHTPTWQELHGMPQS